MKHLPIVACAVASLFLSGPAGGQDRPPPADPLSAHIDMKDVQRFADLWARTGGHPTAAQIDADYIRPGGEGVKIYTPRRIIDGANMERQIAAHRDWYEQALTKCLPWVAQNDDQLRAIYLGLRGLLPEKPLPQIYMVVGGANSGGTAAPGAQVLGLEIICRDGPTPEAFAEQLRNIFAHETAHTFQQPIDASPTALREPLLALILNEGAADYVASLVTGSTPNRARAAFGKTHEAEIWAQFVRDSAVAKANFDPAHGGFVRTGAAARERWLFNNFSNGRLPGWPPDMGYWLGMQIAKAYVERAADPHAAVRELLALEDPAEILRKSGYAGKFAPGP